MQIYWRQNKHNATVNAFYILMFDLWNIYIFCVSYATLQNHYLPRWTGEFVRIELHCSWLFQTTPILTQNHSLTDLQNADPVHWNFIHYFFLTKTYKVLSVWFKRQNWILSVAQVGQKYEMNITHMLCYILYIHRPIFNHKTCIVNRF